MGCEDIFKSYTSKYQSLLMTDIIKVFPIMHYNNLITMNNPGRLRLRLVV